MFKNFNQNRLLAVKCVVILLSIFLMALLLLLIIGKNDSKIPQNEITINVKIDDQNNLDKPIENDQR